VHSISIRIPFLLMLAVGMISLGQTQASAQSEIDVYGGFWIPFLPDYNAAAIVSNGGGTVLRPNLVNDDQSDLGGQIGLRGFYNFAPTRTIVEFDVNVAGIDGMGSRETFADPGPTSTIWMANLAGNAFLASNNGETASFALSSDVLNNSEFIGLRDRFDLCSYGIGLLDLGCGFSHMAYDQDHDLLGQFASGLSGQYLEDVDNRYYGVDIRSTITRAMGNRPVKLDFNVGIYDMDGSYDGTSVFRNAGGAVLNTARVVDSISKTAYTVDLAMRVDANWGGVLVRPGISLKYISDMVSIDHPQSIAAASPVTIGTDDAYVLGVNLEIML
jgi:hypothetical protein